MSNAPNLRPPPAPTTTSSSSSSSPPPLIRFPFIARTFVFVNTNRHHTFWDEVPISLNAVHSDFAFRCLIRTESTAKVFGAVHRPSERPVAIKHRVKVSLAEREYRILKELAGLENTVQLLGAFQEHVMPISYSLVFDCCDSMPVADRMKVLTADDIRFYMFQLLRALHHAHSHGIMHLDVRPENVLIEHRRRIVRLTDWGRAEFYTPARAFGLYSGAFHYRSPELLLKMPFIDYSVDMWAFGCVVASLTYRCPTFFIGFTLLRQFQRICLVLGSRGLLDLIGLYGLPAPEFDFPDVLTRKPWPDLVLPGNEHLLVEHLPDLLDRVLTFNPYCRMTAREAMDHPYFDAVRGTD